jgi:hypothetical protein
MDAYKHRIYGLVALFVVSFGSLAAQVSSEGKIVLGADPRTEGVRLRWEYEQFEDLRLARENGVRLIRETVPGGEVTVLLDKANALPFPAWSATASTSDFAAIISRLLYDVPGSNDPSQAEEQNDQVLNMLLFAAAHDYTAAGDAALAYLDRDVDQTKTYRYTVSIAGLGPAYQNSLVVNAGYRISRKAPQEPSGTWIEQPELEIGLKWFRELTDSLYVSYAVERATEDSNDWRRLNKAPLLQIQNPDAYDTYQYYNDETADRDTTYRYRIYGMTPFGTYGPPSEIIEVPALYRPLVGVPYIKVMTQVVDSLYRVEWIPGEGDESDVVSYRVATSDEAFGEYAYQTDALPPGSVEAVLVDPRDVQYVRVEVTDRRNTVIYSQPKIIRVFDQIPPAPPAGLSGEVDSLGNVILRWSRNKEADLSGYRIYTANRPDGYFPQLTKNEWFGNAYRTEVTMNTRAEEVYYKIKAIDYTGNYSQFSEVLELIRPDFKPPTPPLIKDFRGEETGVKLMTAFSSSDDVAYHLVQRMEGSNWLTVDTVRTEVKVSWLTDTTAAKGVTYDYRIVAVDDVNLRSYSEVIAAGRIDNGIRAAIPEFDALIPAGMENFTVTWRYPTGQDLRGFQLYRANADGQLAAYKFLTASSPELQFRNGKFMFLDRNAGQRQYTYQMMAVHHDGGHSPLTQAITVTRPN